MLRILSKILITVATSGNFICETGEIRYREFGKEIKEKAVYCFSPDHTELRSQNCQSGSCAALSAELSSGIRIEASTVGTPSFSLCRKLGGSPKLIEFRAQGQWHSLDRCYFAADKSFMDCGSLFALKYRQRP